MTWRRIAQPPRPATGLVLSPVPRARGRGKPRVRTGGAAAGPRDIEPTSPRRGSPADPCSGLTGASAGVAVSPRTVRPHPATSPAGRQERPTTPVSGSPVGGSNRGRGCVHRRAPARGRRGPVVGGHASQSQVKGGCRHRQAWVMDRGRCGPDPGERVSVEDGALEPGSGRCTVDPGAQMDKDEHNPRSSRTLGVRSRVTCGQVHRVWITRSSGSRSHLVTAAPAVPGEAAHRAQAPIRPFGSRSGSKPLPVAPIHAPKGARPGSLPARASPGDPRLGPLPPAGVPPRQPTRRQRTSMPAVRAAYASRSAPGQLGTHARPVRQPRRIRSRLADPRRRRPLGGARFAPVTYKAVQQRGPPGCSPVPGEASLVREATAGRRCPERSIGGLSAGTIQVPAGRGEAPPRDGGCALRGLGNPGGPVAWTTGFP